MKLMVNMKNSLFNLMLRLTVLFSTLPAFAGNEVKIILSTRKEIPLKERLETDPLIVGGLLDLFSSNHDLDRMVNVGIDVCDSYSCGFKI